MNHLLNLNNKNYNIMKKVVLTLTALFFTLLSFSQGIAVQGIARDANNTARVNTQLTLQFQVYYRVGPTEVLIYNNSINVNTDFFGVFSHVIDLEDDAGTVTEFGNQELWLRISEGNTVISEAKFNRVPYAYAASNGVPTGSIMPFIGTTAPLGWLLCDGGTIDEVPHTLALRDLLGGVSTTPNLQGMFLRGAGTSPLSTPTVVKAGPALMSTQEDSNKLHSHDVGSIETDEDGEHNHTIAHDGSASSIVYNRLVGLGVGITVARETGLQEARMDIAGSEPMPAAGKHTHDMEGDTGDSGDTESRPVNYGVNYIIKL